MEKINTTNLLFAFMLSTIITATLSRTQMHIMPLQPEHASAAFQLFKDTLYDSNLIPCISPLDIDTYCEEADEEYDYNHAQEVYFDNNGTFLIMVDRDRVVATGALKKIDTSTCELKRLYVAKDYRGKGFGKKMASTLIAEAQLRNYKTIKIEMRQPSRQQAALSLFKSLGFYQIDAYKTVDFPQFSQVVFMEKQLAEKA